MRQIKLPRPERPNQQVPERKHRFRFMHVLTDNSQARLRRRLLRVQDEIHALDKKRVLILRQKEWAAERDESFDLIPPPPLKGLARETVFTALKALPLSATLCSLIFGSVCSALSQQPGSASKTDMFSGFLEAVAVCSLAITCFMVKARTSEFLNDVESQISERLTSLYGRRQAIEEKLGFVQAQEKI